MKTTGVTLRGHYKPDIWTDHNIGERSERERLRQGSDSGGASIGVVTLLSQLVTYRQLPDNQ